MQVDQQELEAVEAKLQRQNGLHAAIAISLWSSPILAFWYLIYQINDSFAPVMLAISGALIGLGVRLHGKGYTPTFGFIAFIAHLLVVIAAFAFGLGLGKGQVVWAFMLVGLYAIGAWLAVFLGRIGIPFEQHKAFFKLTQMSQHSTSRLLKNRWFTVIPITLVGCCFTLFVSLVLLVGVEITRTQEIAIEREERNQRQEQAFENSGIDVSYLSLEKLSSEEAMRHAYAYVKGFLPDRRGRVKRAYPKSEYKAQRVLKFLVEERDYTRAKFVLGLLTYNERGSVLIKEAAEQGDVFAKIHMSTEYGCYGNEQQARELLNRLSGTTDNESAKSEIYSILTVGFTEICAEWQTPDFALMYVRD